MVLAHAAATLVFSLALLKPGACQDIKDVKLENLRWFLAAAEPAPSLRP